jgi:hypothetical protein
VGTRRVVLTSERKQITLPAGSLSAYAGSYDFGDVKGVVTVEDGHLLWQDEGLPKAELFAESQTKFFLRPRHRLDSASAPARSEGRTQIGCGPPISAGVDQLLQKDEIGLLRIGCAGDESRPSGEVY